MVKYHIVHAYCNGRSRIPQRARIPRSGPGVRSSNDWQKATFYISDGAFKNSQNGKADFRLEAMPPEIYVRSVTVTREEIPPSPSPNGE